MMPFLRDFDEAFNSAAFLLHRPAATVPVFGAPNLATTNLKGGLPTAGVRVWTDQGV